MAVQPNSACGAFCYWMLNVSAQHLSGPQRVIVTNVYNAAIGNFPVTDQEWYNFNLFTAWRNPYYLVYRDYASTVAPNLLSMLISSYNLDGNSTDPVSGNNGSDTAIVYSLAAGKINEGALFNGVSSEIALTAIAPGAMYSVALWLKPSPIGIGLEAIMGNNADFTGLYIDKSTLKLVWETSVDNTSASSVSTSAFTCVVVTCDGSYIRMYINGILDLITSNVTGFPIISLIGTNRNGVRYNGDLDILNFWNRALSPAEVIEFYNAGNGIQYPF